MKNLWFTNFILTVIACLLAWTVIHKPAATVLAQDSAGPFTVVTVADPSVLQEGIAGSTQELNAAVGTADIVAAVPLPNQHQIAVILKGRR
jgi:hypothetical protein